MTGQEFIDVAGQLASATTAKCPEGRHRSAVSRAYYGAFHLTVEFLAEFGKRIPANHTGHEAAYRMLFATQVDSAVEAARTLNDLRGVRNRADYNLSAREFNTAINAQEKVQMAISLRANLDACRAEPLKSRIEAVLRSK